MIQRQQRVKCVVYSTGYKMGLASRKINQVFYILIFAPKDENPANCTAIMHERIEHNVKTGNTDDRIREGVFYENDVYGLSDRL